jgi:periplasmic divalent cation tolerance protein
MHFRRNPLAGCAFRFINRLQPGVNQCYLWFMSEELVVLVTASTQEEATTIASTLVSEHLAACVNLIPGIQSVYRWEGKINQDSEILLIIKTTGEQYENLQNRISQLHSYTTPEIIALKIERGSAAYLNWLRQSVTDAAS